MHYCQKSPGVNGLAELILTNLIKNYGYFRKKYDQNNKNEHFLTNSRFASQHHLTTTTRIHFTQLT